MSTFYCWTILVWVLIFSLGNKILNHVLKFSHINKPYIHAKIAPNNN